MDCTTRILRKINNRSSIHVLLRYSFYNHSVILNTHSWMFLISKAKIVPSSEITTNLKSQSMKLLDSGVIGITSGNYEGFIASVYLSVLVK